MIFDLDLKNSLFEGFAGLMVLNHCRVLYAEKIGRRWCVTEWILEYLRGSAEGFRHFPGFAMNPALDLIGRSQEMRAV